MIIAIPLLLQSVSAGESSIKARLLSQYGDSSIRPSAAAGGAFCSTSADVLWTQFYLDRYADDSLSQQSYGLDGYLRSWWNDPRLAFDSSISNDSSHVCTLGKLSFTRAESTRVWKPQYYFERALSVTLPGEREMIDSGAGELFEVAPDGSVFWSQQVSLQLACPLQLEDLPFDTQRCLYRMGLYSQTADEVSPATNRRDFGQYVVCCLPRLACQSRASQLSRFRPSPLTRRLSPTSHPSLLSPHRYGSCGGQTDQPSPSGINRA